MVEGASITMGALEGWCQVRRFELGGSMQRHYVGCAIAGDFAVTATVALAESGHQRFAEEAKRMTSAVQWA